LGKVETYSEVPAIERGLDLLELVGFSVPGLTLSMVARKLEIPKSSAHRLIQAFLNRGYLQRCGDGHHYTLGARAFDFADAQAAEFQLRRLSASHARELVKRVGLTVLMAVRKGHEAVIILKVTVPGDVYPCAWVGHHHDLYCTALGKALIAPLSDAEIDHLLGGRSFLTYTPNTLPSLDALKSDLAEVRIRGFASNNEELAIGGRAVAAPIFNHLQKVVASICVRGSTAQFPEERISCWGKEVAQVAQEISRSLLEPMPSSGPVQDTTSQQL
jgi:DNA-binding IclR family transcriptional regulator